MRRNPRTGSLVPFDFSAIDEEFPAFRQLGVDVGVVTLDPIDSSNVAPDNWIEIARTIRDRYEDYDGFVVLHGTDTMSYTASALSFMLENLSKPVVFTGSQIPLGVLRSDGRENLITAVEIAGAYDGDMPVVPEVSLYFQNRLFRGNRTTKQSAEELNAFCSYNCPALAEVGVNIAYRRDVIMPARHCGEPLAISTDLNADVVVVKLFPGLSDRVLRSMLSAEGLRGVVLETFGSGNAPTGDDFIGAIEDTIARGAVVVNVTQCRGGAVVPQLYETGLRLQTAGVVSGADMTTEAAVTKLMYALGKNPSPDSLRELLSTPLRGEFTR